MIQQSAKHIIISTIASLLVLPAVILLCLVIFHPHSALADEISDAKNELAVTTDELDALSVEIENIYQQSQKLSDEIEEKANEIQSEQVEINKLTAKHNQALIALYKNGKVELLDLLLSSQSFEELIENFSYAEHVEDYVKDLLIQHKNLQKRIDFELNDLHNRKAEKDALIAQLEQRKEDLSDKTQKLKEKIDELDEQQRIAYFAALSELSQAQLFETGDTTGWQTGIASAYGGYSDAPIPDNQGTATGDPVTETSMGVAIPMAWDNFRSYYGRKVEISYNGQSVIATVNDCGYMGGGSRCLDLQPGIFHAFGFDTCDEWGLREVSYRFL